MSFLTLKVGSGRSAVPELSLAEAQNSTEPALGDSDHLFVVRRQLVVGSALDSRRSCATFSQALALGYSRCYCYDTLLLQIDRSYTSAGCLASHRLHTSVMFMCAHACKRLADTLSLPMLVSEATVSNGCGCRYNQTFNASATSYLIHRYRTLLKSNHSFRDGRSTLQTFTVPSTA